MTLSCILLLAAALSNNTQAPEQTLATIPIEQLPDFDAHRCTPARVEWIDAMIVTRGTDTNGSPSALDIELSIPRVSSYGCVNKTENAVVVIHTFSRGVPDDYLIVPRGWVTAINPFDFRENEPAAPEKPAENKIGI